MRRKTGNTNYGCSNRFYGNMQLMFNGITNITDLHTKITDCHSQKVRLSSFIYIFATKKQENHYG